MTDLSDLFDVVLPVTKKGKNFSLNNVSGKRRKSDLYETPYSMTRHALRTFFPMVDTGWRVLEPASGNGAIVKILREYGFREIVNFDLDVDFLKYDSEEKYDLVFTNPPFSLALEFIQKAKQLSRDEIVMLLPLNYLHGKKRFDTLYQDKSFGLKDVAVFTRYPMLGDDLRADGKYKTGTMVYAWYRWKIGYGGAPVIRWLDNDEDVL